MNINLRAEVKNNFEKDFFKLMNNSVFRKTMERQRQYRGSKFVATERRTNYLVSGTNYYEVFDRKFACNTNQKDSSKIDCNV